MNKKLKSIFMSSVVVCLFPMASYADYVVTNNTHSYSTASAINTGTKVETGCSSAGLGDLGRMKPVDQAPENSFKIPEGLVTLACNPSCDVTVFMSRDCDARKIAVVPISANGIGEPRNIPNADGFYISRKNAHEVSIEGPK